MGKEKRKTEEARERMEKNRFDRFYEPEKVLYEQVVNDISLDDPDVLDIICNFRILDNPENAVAWYIKGKTMLKRPQIDLDNLVQAINYLGTAYKDVKDETRVLFHSLIQNCFISHCIDGINHLCDEFKNAASSDRIGDFDICGLELTNAMNICLLIGKKHFQALIAEINEEALDIPVRCKILETVLEALENCIYPAYCMDGGGYPSETALDVFLKKTRICWKVFCPAIEKKSDFTYGFLAERMRTFLDAVAYESCSYETGICQTGTDLCSGTPIYGKWHKIARKLSNDERKEWFDRASLCDSFIACIDGVRGYSPDKQARYWFDWAENDIRLAAFDEHEKKYGKAKKKYITANKRYIDIVKELKVYDYELRHARLYNLLGVLYLRKKRRIPASYFWKEALSILLSPKSVLKNEDEFFLAEVHVNYGKLCLSYRTENRMEEATQHISEAERICFSGSTPKHKKVCGLSVRIHCIWGVVFIAKGMEIEAEKRINKAINLYENDSDIIEINDKESLESIADTFEEYVKYVQKKALAKQMRKVIKDARCRCRGWME